MDAEQLADRDVIAGLFADLPARGHLGILAGFEPATRHGPGGSSTFVPVRQQDALVLIQDDRVCGDAQVHASP
jgi:hypothetical protein